METKQFLVCFKSLVNHFAGEDVPDKSLSDKAQYILDNLSHFFVEALTYPSRKEKKRKSRRKKGKRNDGLVLRVSSYPKAKRHCFGS